MSGVAFFVKLNETLATQPMIEYYNRDGISVCEPYKSSQTNLQVIQNCLQAMQTRCVVEGSTECPELFFVGTHNDLQCTEESLESKNVQLLKDLRQHSIFRKHLAYYSLGNTDQLLFPVNAKTPSTEDEKVVERFRQCVMERCQKHQRKIPIRWFVLESLLQELAQSGVISYIKCLEVAKRLGMDEDRLRAAIDYLAQLNMFEFFPEVLPEVVFTTSQVLLTKITELVEYSHILRNESKTPCTSEDQEFRDNGYVSVKILKRFSSHYVDGLFEADNLLALLQNRLVITKRDGDTFIMTSVLPELSPEKLDNHRSAVSSSSTHLPIAVHYPGSLFPVGIFTSLVSYLQTKLNWTILMDKQTGKPKCLFKNCVDFVIDTKDMNAAVTLMYTHEWIELHTHVYGNKHCAFSIQTLLFDGLKHVAEIQKYSHIVPELAFFCPQEDGMAESAVKCQLPFLHLATVTSDQRYLRCEQDDAICYKLTGKYCDWITSSIGMIDNAYQFLL